MKVLIVDDDRIVASYIRKQVASWNHYVSVAQSCRMAATRLATEAYDLMLLDVFLPDGPGHLRIPQFRMLSPGMDIIVMTGKNSRKLEKEARVQGIAYYLIKPFEMKHLKTIVNHLDQRKGGAANGSSC